MIPPLKKGDVLVSKNFTVLVLDPWVRKDNETDARVTKILVLDAADSKSWDDGEVGIIMEGYLLDNFNRIS